jgi:hypothetical protein
LANMIQYNFSYTVFIKTDLFLCSHTCTCKLLYIECLTNAVPGPSTEWNVSKWMSAMHSFRQEVVRVEFFWARKYLWVPVYHIWNNRNICPNRDSIVLWNNNPDQAQYKIQYLYPKAVTSAVFHWIICFFFFFDTFY